MVVKHPKVPNPLNDYLSVVELFAGNENIELIDYKI